MRQTHQNTDGDVAWCTGKRSARLAVPAVPAAPCCNPPPPSPSRAAAGQEGAHYALSRSHNTCGVGLSHGLASPPTGKQGGNHRCIIHWPCRPQQRATPASILIIGAGTSKTRAGRQATLGPQTRVPGPLTPQSVPSVIVKRHGRHSPGRGKRRAWRTCASRALRAARAKSGVISTVCRRAGSHQKLHHTLHACSSPQSASQVPRRPHRGCFAFLKRAALSIIIGCNGCRHGCSAP